jgi:hypothetical protein
MKEEKQEELKTKKITKEERIEKRRKGILDSVATGNVQSFRDRVAFILNHFYEARNSDVDLVCSYWNTFEKDKFDGDFITRDTLKNLTVFSSLTRMRRKIQNDYKLFEASDEIKKIRRILKEDKVREALEDKSEVI